MPFFIVTLHPRGRRGTLPWIYWVLVDHRVYASAEDADDAAEQYRFIGKTYTVVEANSERHAQWKVLQNWPPHWPGIPDAASHSGRLGLIRDILEVPALIAVALVSKLRYRFRAKPRERNPLMSAKRQYAIRRVLNEHRVSHPNGIARPYSCARCAELLTELHPAAGT